MESFPFPAAVSSPPDSLSKLVIHYCIYVIHLFTHLKQNKLVFPSIKPKSRTYHIQIVLSWAI